MVSLCYLDPWTESISRWLFLIISHWHFFDICCLDDFNWLLDDLVLFPLDWSLFILNGRRLPNNLFINHLLLCSLLHGLLAIDSALVKVILVNDLALSWFNLLVEVVLW